MEYRLEYARKHNFLRIHVSKIIVDSPQRIYDRIFSNVAEQPLFVQDIFNMNGVVEIILHKHQIIIKKAEVYEWKKLVPDIMMVLLMHFEPHGELTEKAPPIMHDEYDNSETVDEKKKLDRLRLFKTEEEFPPS